MKKRIIILLSIALTALMTFTSCKSVRKAPEDTEAPSVSDKKDTPKDGNEASADTDIPAGKADGTNENIPANAPEASSDNTGKADNSESEKEGEPSRDEQNGAPDTDSGNSSEPPKYMVGTSSSYAYISPEEMLTKSDLIFIGEFTGQSSQKTPDMNYVDSNKQYEKVYTDYVFKSVAAVKGEPADEIIVRSPGGRIGDIWYNNTNTPQLKEGKKYLIYLKKREPISADDQETYRIITEYCFELDENGKIVSGPGSDEDKAKFQAQYDAALADIQTETEKDVQNNETK